MIIALAGRRVDAPSAPVPTFPLQHARQVQRELAALFESSGGTALVSSAACGADLLALEAARELGMRRRVVLPSPRESFRRTSVIDRPGDWGALFDEICDAAERSGELVVMDDAGSGDDGYLRATERIVAEALSLAGSRGPAGVLAVAVWNGPRESGFDATRAFRDAATRARIRVEEVHTLPPK